MPVELTVPSLGESIREVVVGKWLKKPGEAVGRDEPLVEVESDKATVELPAPEAGTLTTIIKKEGETAAVGEVIGLLSAARVAGAQETKPPSGTTPSAAAAQQMEAASGAAPLKQFSAPAMAPPPAAPRAERREEAVPMSPLRRSVAARLVEAQRTAALLSTFNEIDMSAVVELRRNFKEAFLQRYGVKLGFMSFFVRASIEALKQFPALNAEIRDDAIVYHNYYDIGIAVSGGKGLVVPVLRNAERLSFAEIETQIDDFARRARENKLSLEELSGGTFTITNGGVFGSMLSTPIVNPPQSGILGMHAIQDRPVARDGQIVIRPMMYVALTYDHRIVDGREAVQFLYRIKEVIERPERMILEI
ncbi:dihydrolipoyllysine-residue succinyltransferase [bacterium]|nr:dihydrolipoyllysine-residue succinyltransferase [bacterium]